MEKNIKIKGLLFFQCLDGSCNWRCFFECNCLWSLHNSIPDIADRDESYPEAAEDTQKDKEKEKATKTEKNKKSLQLLTLDHRPFYGKKATVVEEDKKRKKEKRKKKSKKKKGGSDQQNRRLSFSHAKMRYDAMSPESSDEDDDDEQEDEDEDVEDDDADHQRKSGDVGLSHRFYYPHVMRRPPPPPPPPPMAAHFGDFLGGGEDAHEMHRIDRRQVRGHGHDHGGLMTVGEGGGAASYGLASSLSSSPELPFEGGREMVAATAAVGRRKMGSSEEERRRLHYRHPGEKWTEEDMESGDVVETEEEKEEEARRPKKTAAVVKRSDGDGEREQEEEDQVHGRNFTMAPALQKRESLGDLLTAVHSSSTFGGREGGGGEGGRAGKAEEEDEEELLEGEIDGGGDDYSIYEVAAPAALGGVAPTPTVQAQLAQPPMMPPAGAAAAANAAEAIAEAEAQVNYNNIYDSYNYNYGATKSGRGGGGSGGRRSFLFDYGSGSARSNWSPHRMLVGQDLLWPPQAQPPPPVQALVPPPVPLPAELPSELSWAATALDQETAHHMDDELGAARSGMYRSGANVDEEEQMKRRRFSRNPLRFLELEEEDGGDEGKGADVQGRREEDPGLFGGEGGGFVGGNVFDGGFFYSPEPVTTGKSPQLPDGTFG